MTSIDYAGLAAGNLVFAVLSFVAAVALLLGGRTLLDRAVALQAVTVLAVSGLAGTLTWYWLRPGWELLAYLLPGLFLPVLANRWLKGFSFTGSFLMSAHANVTLAGLLWGFTVIATADVGPLTRTLILVTFAVAAVSLTVGLIQSFEQWEVICRRDWRRPRVPAASAPRKHHPRVSLHVPAYAEPPELVIATLDALAQLNYPNFEVLVIDNNTPDPALWRPVEAHCRTLGERFRFFHVERLPGAKAGALNFALRHTAADAELVGVIDSDYEVHPDFLDRLFGHFDDPGMGFVQTPQAYREWESSRYLRMCNWEYRLVFATTLVSRNERMAAITVGTMGLIRRRVLEQVGGWAEWCVTEDSELAVRIHALGYRSLYLNSVFGTGLIPESFQDYKKQRFRWTYGPIQELRRHFRLFLPAPLARPSALTSAQKLHHLIHGLGALKSGLEFLLLPLGGVAITSMQLHGESIGVPSFLWPVLGAAAVAAFILKWHLFRTSMACSFRDMLGAMLAGIALDYTIRIAALWGLFTRNTPWRRTNKFRTLPLGLGALGPALHELLLGGGILTAAIGVLGTGHLSGLVRLIALGWSVQGGRFLTAPLLSVLSDQDISQRARHCSAHTLNPPDGPPVQSTDT